MYPSLSLSCSFAQSLLLVSDVQESILQLLDSLEKLDFVAETIFARIEARVNQNRARIGNLGNRSE